MNRKINLLILATGVALSSLAGVDQTVPVALKPFGVPIPTVGNILSPGLPTVGNIPSPGVKRAPSQTIFTPDWIGTFSSQEDFDLFTVIDANGDANESMGTWMWLESAGGVARYAYSYYAYGEDVDDWIITPGLRLKAGKQYKLSFLATNYSTFYDDKMAVTIGKEPSVAGQTETLLPTFSILSDGWTEHTVAFTVEEDGIYYIGFNLCEAGYMSTCYLDHVAVTGEPLPKSPAAVSDLKIVPDLEGEPSATVTFIAPDKAVDGSALSSLKGVKIRNGYVDIADLENVKPGEEVSCTVNFDKADLYTVNVLAYNDVDEGIGTSQSLYIGLDIPATPQNVVMHDDVEKIRITADPLHAAHEGVFFPAEADFNVFEITRDEYGFPAVGDLVASVTGETEILLGTSTVEGPQSLISYVTNATNKAGASPNYYQTNSLVLGAPYSLPYEDTFDGGQSGNFYMTAVNRTGFGNTGIFSSIIDSYGFKPGCMLLSAVSAGDVAAFYTGKLDIQNVESPIFSFAMKSLATTEGKVEILVRDMEGKDTVIDTLFIDDLSDEWAIYNYDLSAWSGNRFIHTGLRYSVEARDNNNQIWFDDIFVGSLPQSDLTVNLSCSPIMARGEENELTLRIDNKGANTVDSFHLTIEQNGEVISDAEVECNLPARGCTIVKAPVKILPIENASKIEFKATVAIEGDAAIENNVSSIEVEIIDPDLAAPDGLTAEGVADGVLLSWQKVSNLAPKTDDFESYELYNYLDDWGWVEHNVGPWTMVDVDLGSTGGFSESLYYGSQGQKFAYTVFNPYNYSGYGASLFTVISEEVGASFIPRKGTQYLAGIYSADTYWDGEQYVGTIKDADNWVISPEQTGDAQTISFWVNNFKGLSGNGNVIDHVESYQVLVSKSDMEIESFELLGETRQASGGNWQQVSVDLPAGTKYFAIRHCSPYDATMGTPFIFMVDDITYNVPNKPVAGYNVYRDGILIATTDKDTTEYTDLDLSGNDHLYQVTVVYEDGTESAAVSANYITVGVNHISADRQVFDIFSATGILVKRNATDFDLLPPGVYFTSDGRKKIVR